MNSRSLNELRGCLIGCICNAISGLSIEVCKTFTLLVNPTEILIFLSMVGSSVALVLNHGTSQHIKFLRSESLEKEVHQFSPQSSMMCNSSMATRTSWL